ncbi:microcystin LR degradation protein MlrC-like protein [Xylophilus rhododendri]|uniref:Microcystinase C n=1 Tax=Xylophilus rhododendri TaxID=2697032 RepID=A0A857J9I6_9BURK|nr:M81 family metallopeptidase [Xylophilus rhododendri]QHI99652.1 microcystin LR degradation protein MlrC-like protein [Xylophilus rhododendri]
MRMFTASLGTESNTFSPMFTSLDDYREAVYVAPGEHPADIPMQCTAQLVVAREFAAREGFELVEGSCFFASPGGITNRQDYEFMRDTILREIAAAMPLDTLVLGLHGAMVADGYDDTEGDLIDAARAIVGDGCVLGVELDPHCHLTLRRVRQADAIVMYKEYPHTDTMEAARELIEIVLKIVRGAARPVMSVYDCKQLGSFPTTHPEMRAFVDYVKTLENQGPILSISIGHSYPYGDVPELGARILVIADDDKAAGDAMAERVGRQFMQLRGRTTPAFLGIDAGLDAALARAATASAPIVVTDAADNAGGGAPADNTSILHRLIERGITDAALAPLWDPMAVRHCFSAGVGARFRLRFGGKTGTISGAPVDADVEVLALVRDAWQTYGPARTTLGDAAAVRIGGVEVVINSSRTQALGPELFSQFGIDIAGKRLLVLKSSNHFMAGFGQLIGGVVHVHTDGLLVRDDYRRIAYSRVQRPIWPLDEALQGELLY